MPLTPEDTQTENSDGKSEDKSAAGVRAVLNSRYLKPVAALLVALGAGFLVQRMRGWKNVSKR